MAAAAKQVVIVGGGSSQALAPPITSQRRAFARHLLIQLALRPLRLAKPAASALDWNDGAPVGPLARKSFALHAELAETFGASNIDYRRLCARRLR